MKDLNNISVNTLLKKINMEVELNKKEDFKKVDFNLLVSLLHRLGYDNEFYNDDYEFEIDYDLDIFSILNKDDATSYNLHFIIRNDYVLMKICRDDYKDFSITDYNYLPINFYIKNINKYVLANKIKNLHFTKLEFIKLFSLVEEKLKEHNLKINCFIIETGRKFTLKYDSIESLKNTDFDFRDLVIKGLK